MASSADTTSAIVAKRSSGDFARHRRTTSVMAAGIAGCAFDRSEGSRVSTASSVASVLSAVNGRAPASISWSITPSAKMSARPSTASPRICSGAMYPAVPANSDRACSPNGASEVAAGHACS